LKAIKRERRAYHLIRREEVALQLASPTGKTRNPLRRRKCIMKRRFLKVGEGERKRFVWAHEHLIGQGLPEIRGVQGEYSQSVCRYIRVIAGKDNKETRLESEFIP